MSLHWPWALAALVAMPLLLALRWWLNRRRRRLAVRVSSVALIRAALPGRSLWRRRIPVLLFAAGLLALGVGVARPQASVTVPANSTSILLAIDVSTSMCSTDVDPNRLTVARAAARDFVSGQDDGTRIGLVAFSGIAGLLVEPTTDRDALLAAIDTLRTSRGTAIGLAILTAIDAIAEVNPDVAPTGVDLGTGGDPGTTAAPGSPGTPGTPGSGTPGSGPPGGYEPDTIVVLTDGANSTGVDPVTAAEEAAARRLRVYTIGFGTARPAPMVCSVDQINDDGWFPGDGWGGPGGGGLGGGVRRLQRIDEPTLTEVADLTGGRYFRAEDSEQLADVLGDLPSQIDVQRRDMEITSWFALVGALLVLAAGGLSLWWTRAPRSRSAAPPPPAATGPP